MTIIKTFSSEDRSDILDFFIVEDEDIEHPLQFWRLLKNRLDG